MTKRPSLKGRGTELFSRAYADLPDKPHAVLPASVRRKGRGVEVFLGETPRIPGAQADITPLQQNTQKPDVAPRAIPVDRLDTFWKTLKRSHRNLSKPHLVIVLRLWDIQQQAR